MLVPKIVLTIAILSSSISIDLSDLRESTFEERTLIELSILEQELASNINRHESLGSRRSKNSIDQVRSIRRKLFEEEILDSLVEDLKLEESNSPPK